MMAQYRTVPTKIRKKKQNAYPKKMLQDDDCRFHSAKKYKLKPPSLGDGSRAQGWKKTDSYFLTCFHGFFSLLELMHLDESLEEQEV